VVQEFTRLGEDVPHDSITVGHLDELTEREADMLRRVYESQVRKLPAAESAVRGILQLLAVAVDD
jgi:hypothetical protein